VLITIDTCRADRIGCYGAENVHTPTIDDLAERGVTYLDASAPAPLTLPSHCTILTGLYPDRHSVRDNGANALPDDAETLAEILRDEGWRTGGFVSAFPLEAGFGADQGFDAFDDDLSESAVGAAANVPEDAARVAERLFYEERTASSVVDAAIPWLREARRGPAPWFLWVHFFDPHAVYRPPAHLASRYGADSYEGEVAYVDEQLARLLAELGGASDDVTIVVTADHGESLGEHEENTHGLFIYQSSLHVPWVMAGPGIPAGVRVEEPVSLVHVMPTILDLVDVAGPPGLDGASTRALWDGVGGEANEAASAPVHGECLLPRLHYDWAGLRSVRRDRWKLIDAPRPELFDLVADPHETRNVAEEHPDVVNDLRAELRAHASRGGALEAEARELDADALARLESLGYVGAGASTALADDDVWNPQGRDPKDMVDYFNALQEIPTLLLGDGVAEAERMLDELHAEDPSNRAVLRKLSMLHGMEENWEEARHWCELFLDAEPGNAEVRRNLAFVLNKLGDRDGARREYRQAAADDPDDADTWGLLGSLLSEDGLHAQAILAFERAVGLAPEDAQLRAELARAWADSGDVDRAVAEYDRALALDPERSEAVNGKALLLSHAGRPREAVETLRAAMPALADDLETLNNLAWILANESIDPEEAYRHARAAARLDSEDPAILDTLGWASIRSGRAAEAVPPLTKAWEISGDVEVRLHLGIALAESGRVEEGRAHVREAIRERPELGRVPEAGKWR
jgi:arylsulfatase A-like enzyme/Flp pilus assembly protein TadD